MNITRFEHEATKSARNFCAACGTPIFYERGHTPRMVNIPRALFDERVGREPLYHVGISEKRDWIYTNAPLRPLKGYPGVVWERPGRKRRDEPDLF